MSDLLAQYKQSVLSTLTAEYNAALRLLANKLAADLAFVNSNNRISKIIKLQLMNQLKNTYNTNVRNLTTTFNQNKSKVNGLTAVPIRKQSLLIGINYIGTPNELYGCINDAININECFKSCSITNTCFMTDLTNKKPTKQNIMNELNNLLVQSYPGDSVFFSFSGHGSNIVDRSADELDGFDELIAPLGFTYNVNSFIIDDELRALINLRLRSGVKLFMLFDSCFSGTILDLKYHYLDSDNYENVTVNPKVSETKGQVITISGCKDSQYSADTVVDYGNKKNMYSGAMTYSFLKTIQDLGVKISFRTLLQNMRTILREGGYEQIPQLLSGQQLNMDELIWLN
jgi:hypothetical protein